MRDEIKRGVLVVGHGSRREEANEDVREAARRIGVRGGFPLVEAAFLEIAHPDIAAGFRLLVEQDAGDITVHPYFLSPGRHTRGDIPVEVCAAAQKFPHVTYRISEPLSAHRFVIDASVERIGEVQAGTVAESENFSAQRFACQAGTVYLVGAGPGDPGLLTLKARDLLASCDVVVYDYLVNPEVLRHVPPQSERVYVGKVGGGRQTPQPEIDRLLVAHARSGKRVVRLKGGDPFIFGRGAEEAEALRAAGLFFEVVPGISSAIAAPAYAGIPLTHRTLSSSVAIITGTTCTGSDEPLACSLARLSAAETLVILMGIRNLREITQQLIATGRAPETPIAIVRWGTHAGQQTVTGTLRTIEGEVAAAGLRAPAVIVVGDVVNLREHLQWFERKCESDATSDETATPASVKTGEYDPGLPLT